jgi:cob(I)alamin adenosyltransferase
MGLILIYTGDGKGKSTAGIGQLIRALGHGQRCAVIQFIKQGPDILKSGEFQILSRLGVEWKNYGAGFSWIGDNDKENRELAQRGWEHLKQWLESGVYDLILADEFTYLLSLGYLDEQEICTYLRDQKGQKKFPHLVITGRNAPKILIEVADMVSSIAQIKHHLYDQGVGAQPMIEF